MGKKWIIATIIVCGIILGIGLGIYLSSKNDVSEMNTIDMQKLAETTNAELKDNQVELNETIETSMANNRVSPNAIVIEKRYYKSCDHLIREVVDIPEDLVNKKEEDVKKAYAGWKVEGYSPTEIVVYKEFKGICNEHYVVKEHNGVIAIYVEDDNHLLEWQEDTEIMIQYLPDEDLENLKAGVKVVGKTNLNNFLEDYE